MTGKFIAFEGMEGVGKSTNIELVAGLIRDAGYEVVVTREPGGTVLGEKIRSLLLDKDEQGMTAMTELLLMFAARAQHLEEVILPALARGIWVISDRFTDSSYAYQGGGREMGEAPITQLESLVVGSHKPDITLMLDSDIEIGLGRAAARGEADRFESEQQAFFERVRAAYLARADQENCHVIDAARPLEEVQCDIRQLMESYLK